MSELRQRVPASASASESSEVSTSSTTTAKTTPAATTPATPAEKPVTAEDSQRAVRFLAMLSLAIVVVPLVAWYLTQQLFGVGNLYGAFAAVTAVNIVMIFTVCLAPKYS